MDEEILVLAYRLAREMKENPLTYEEMKLIRSMHSAVEAYRALNDMPTTSRTHPCPGDGIRGCGVTIPDYHDRCYFCAKTVRLRVMSRGTV